MPPETMSHAARDDDTDRYCYACKRGHAPERSAYARGVLDALAALRAWSNIVGARALGEFLISCVEHYCVDASTPGARGGSHGKTPTPALVKGQGTG